MEEKCGMCGNAGKIIAVIILAVGIALGGCFIGRGFYKSRGADRYVTVKGLAEVSVAADMAFWPIRFSVSDNDLTTAMSRIRENERIVRQFLIAHGLNEADITVNNFEVSDLRADPYNNK